MVLAAVRRLTSGPLPVVALFALLLTSLWLMSAATQNSAQFGQVYSLLLVLNVLATLLLIALIGTNLVRLRRRYRAGETGSRLTARLVLMFVVLSLVPVSVVYYFSVGFLHRGIDSWFDVRVEVALEDALELSRASLGMRMRELLRHTEQLSEELVNVSDSMAALALNGLRERSGASELSLFSQQGHIIATSSADPGRIVPTRPHESILLQLRPGNSYVGLDPASGSGLHVRVAVNVRSASPVAEPRVLQALFPVTGRMNALADSVQSAYAQYRELTYLRTPLKYSFTLTLSLVLLLTMLAAVWAAFFSARRLAAPISDLAEGTRAVAAGDYDKRLPAAGRDDIGQLVRSFNEMTRRIALARDDARRSQQQAEEQRTYLEAVLGRLSSGVLTVDTAHLLHTANAAASQILGVDLDARLGSPLGSLPKAHPYLNHFVQAIQPHLTEDQQEWREEVILFGAGGRQVLMCRGTRLPSVGDTQGGYVIVFDDVTALIQAQRDAAWSEVARRLAHEIKNPLTPIQLSAERLRRKYLDTLPEEDAKVLDRSTHTIVQQVEAMKEMVKAFSEYAYTPRMHPGPLDLNRLIGDVLDLYRGDEAAVRYLVNLDPLLPPIEADAGRLRQLMHNLLKNALEAMTGQPGRISITTRCMRESSCRFVELRVQDSGPGIPQDMMDRLFEPYVTSKPKGTGLGLAIVKKIVEEHGGMLWAENTPGAGACIVIRLPALSMDAPDIELPTATDTTSE